MKPAFLKWPECRGSLVSEVQIRGSSLQRSPAGFCIVLCAKERVVDPVILCRAVAWGYV